MLGAPSRLGFRGPGVGDSSPRLPPGPGECSLDLLCSSRKWDQTAAGGGVRARGARTGLEAPRGWRGPAWAGPTWVGTRPGHLRRAGPISPSPDLSLRSGCDRKGTPSQSPFQGCSEPFPHCLWDPGCAACPHSSIPQTGRHRQGTALRRGGVGRLPPRVPPPAPPLLPLSSTPPCRLCPTHSPCPIVASSTKSARGPGSSPDITPMLLRNIRARFLAPGSRPWDPRRAHVSWGGADTHWWAPCSPPGSLSRACPTTAL